MGNTLSPTTQQIEQINVLNSLDDIKKLNDLAFLRSLHQQQHLNEDDPVNSSGDLIDIYSTTHEDQIFTQVRDIFKAANPLSGMQFSGRHLEIAREPILTCMLHDIVNKLQELGQVETNMDGNETFVPLWDAEKVQPKQGLFNRSADLSVWHFLFASSVALFTSTMVDSDNSRRGESLERLSLSLINVLDLSRR